MVMSGGNDQKNELVDTSCQNEIPPLAGFSHCDRGRSTGIQEDLEVKSLPLGVKRWFGHLIKMPPGHLPGEVFGHIQLGGDPRGDLRHPGEIISLG